MKTKRTLAFEQFIESARQLESRSDKHAQLVLEYSANAIKEANRHDLDLARHYFSCVCILLTATLMMMFP